MQLIPLLFPPYKFVTDFNQRINFGILFFFFLNQFPLISNNNTLPQKRDHFIQKGF